MRLLNDTSVPAALYSGPAAERSLGCALLVKATFEIRPSGALETAREKPWPVLAEALETPWGVFPQELAGRKPKLDLVVLAVARPPRHEPAPAMTVTVHAGRFRHSLAVFGARRWERTLGRFFHSGPEPFQEMPLTWARAYGGKVPSELGVLACGDNPAGKGFVLAEADAEGVELPNVEDPRALVRRPSDRPKPAGWGPYPLDGGLRLAGLVLPDGRPAPAGESAPLRLNWAHPDLMLSGLEPGVPLAVDGVTGGAPLSAAVPRCPVRAVVENGREVLSLALLLDTLVLSCEEKRLVARWRAAATFPIRPRERRRVVVRPVEGGPA